MKLGNREGGQQNTLSYSEVEKIYISRWQLLSRGMIGVGEEAGGKGAGMEKSWKLHLRGVSIR